MAIKLRLDQLERIAQDQGYTDYRSMLYDLYVVQRLGLAPVAEKLHIAPSRVRKHLFRFGLRLRGKGGRQVFNLAITNELVEEVTRDGVSAVARRLGVEQQILLRDLTAFARRPT